MLCWPDTGQNECSAANRCCAGAQGEEASGLICSVGSQGLVFQCPQSLVICMVHLHTTHHLHQSYISVTRNFKQIFDLFCCTDECLNAA